jgi:acyl carrier protein
MVENLEERLKGMVAEVIGLSKDQASAITKDTLLKGELGADSVHLAELAMKLEDDLEIPVPNSYMVRTFGQLVFYADELSKLRDYTRQIFSEHTGLPIDKINNESDLRKIAQSPYAAPAVLFRMENDKDLTIPDTDAPRLNTVTEFVRYLGEKLLPNPEAD